MNTIKRALFGALLASSAQLLAGCVSGGVGYRTFDPSRPIKIEGLAYVQGRKEVDGESLSKGLSREAEAGRLVMRARGLGVLSALLIGAGSGMMAWPLAEIAVNGKSSHGALAAIGGGVDAVGIVVSVCANIVLREAVEAHNRKFGFQATQGLQLEGSSLVYKW